MADRLAGHFRMLVQRDATRRIPRLDRCPPAPAVVLLQRGSRPERIAVVGAAGADAPRLVPWRSTLGDCIAAAVAHARSLRVTWIAVALSGGYWKGIAPRRAGRRSAFPRQFGRLGRREMHGDLLDVRRCSPLNHWLRRRQRGRLPSQGRVRRRIRLGFQIRRTEPGRGVAAVVAAGLLNDMRQFVGDQRAPGRRFGRVLPGREDDVGADGVGERVQGSR